MAALRFLDTNVLLRHLTGDDAQKANRAMALLHRVEEGDERVATSQMVIFEVVFTLQTSYRLSKPRIRELLLPLSDLPGIEIPDKSLFAQAFEIYIDQNVSFSDGYNAAYMKHRNINEIYSWDADFNRIPGIVRVEP